MSPQVALRNTIFRLVNLGPLGTIEARDHDMKRAVETLGEHDAGVLLDLILATEGECHEGVDLRTAMFRDTAMEFAELYAARFPTATAAQGLQRLHTCSPGLVTILGETKDPSIVGPLLDTIQPASAPPDLLFAFVDCLAAIGNESARKALRALHQHEGLDPEVHHEVDVALACLGEAPRARRHGGDGTPSEFATALRALLEESRRFVTLEDWCSFLGVTRGTMEEWLGDTTFPPPKALAAVVHELTRQSAFVSTKALVRFRDLCDKPSTAVSPHGKTLGPTVGHYILTAERTDFLDALVALPFKDQARLLRMALGTARILAHVAWTTSTTSPSPPQRETPIDA